MNIHKNARREWAAQVKFGADQRRSAQRRQYTAARGRLARDGLAHGGVDARGVGPALRQAPGEGSD